MISFGSACGRAPALCDHRHQTRADPLLARMRAQPDQGAETEQEPAGSEAGEPPGRRALHHVQASATNRPAHARSSPLSARRAWNEG